MDDLYQALIDGIVAAWGLDADQVVIGPLRAERARPWAAITCSTIRMNQGPGGRIDYIIDRLAVAYSGDPQGGVGDRAKVAMALSLITEIGDMAVSTYSLDSPTVAMDLDIEESDDTRIVFEVAWEQVEFTVC
jgi:hypothetical protein